MLPSSLNGRPGQGVAAHLGGQMPAIRSQKLIAATCSDVSDCGRKAGQGIKCEIAEPQDGTELGNQQKIAEADTDALRGHLTGRHGTTTYAYLSKCTVYVTHEYYYSRFCPGHLTLSAHGEACRM